MRWLILIPLTCLMIGCDAGDGSNEGTAPQVQPQAAITAADLDAKNPLHLVGVDGEIHLGVSRADSSKAFPKPELATLISDLPTVLHGTPGLSSESWQYGDKGFGIILLNDRLAMAVQQQNKLTEDQLRTILRTARDRNGDDDRPIGGRFVRYYFWEREKQTLMICAFQSPDSSWNVTSALGTDQLMKALHMSRDQANLDTDGADGVLEDFFQKQNKPLPPKPRTDIPSEGPSATPSTGGGILNGFR